MPEVMHGLEGVVAFETEIAEPDKDGSALRYRGVDIEDLAGRVPFEKVWGLLVDGSYEPGLPPAEPFPIPVHSGDIRVDVQSAIAMIAPAWGMRQLLRHRRRAGAGRPRAHRGDGAVVRRAGRTRHRRAYGPAVRGRQGAEHHREVHDAAGEASPTRGMCRRSTRTGRLRPSTA